MRTQVALLLIWITPLGANSQDQQKQSAFNLSGYMEAYYLYDFNKPDNHTRPAFIYSHNRANEFNINLAFIKAAYSRDNLRANIAFMTGTYANANLSDEPIVFRNVLEANAGVKLSAEKTIWLDVGILPSHIGFESSVSKDSWNVTRSILADNSPYYESGVKITYTTTNGNWFLSGLILNGWQQIQMADGNITPALGTQVTYKPTAIATLNYSTFIGTDRRDSVELKRFFNNFYGIIDFAKFGFIVGFDVGLEQKRLRREDFDLWYSPVLILKIKPSEKFIVAFRAERYSDRNGIIIPGEPGFKVAGVSANLDYFIAPNALWRFEIRNLTSPDNIFMRNNKPVNNSYFITSALVLDFKMD